MTSEDPTEAPVTPIRRRPAAAPSSPTPPEHLSAEAKAWFVAVVELYEFEPHTLKVLEAACDALDRMNQARSVVLEVGPFVDDRYGTPKVHPAATLERDSRLAFARLVRELGIDQADAPGTRPPRIGGSTR